jgi:MutS domain V
LERLRARDAEVVRHNRLHLKIGYSKLATLVVTAAMAWLSFAEDSFSGWWLLAPVAFYAALAVWHERVLRAKARAEAAALFYRRGIARMEDRWQGGGAETGERFRDAQHPYAEDLDLFGCRSIFELLCTARTTLGEDRLASWLLAAAAPVVIRERQEMIAELRPKLDLREALAVIGTELRPLLDAAALTAWAEDGSRLPAATIVRPLAVVLAAAATVTGVGCLFGWPLGFFLFGLLANLLLLVGLYKRTAAVVASLHGNSQGFAVLAEILDRLEAECFQARGFERLQARLAPQQASTDRARFASRAMRRLAHTQNWIESRDGFMVKLLELPLLYTIQLAYAADAWRSHYGTKLGGWLESVADIEALLSLATYSFEHPRDPFPQIADAEPGQPLYCGENLGHPLLPQAACVRNSARLDSATRVLLVSGSNMSGKSTYLRTVGVNAVLAFCGAPVRADSMRLSPLAVGTRLRSSDSLQEGRSGFYTEVLRIRLVFGLLEGSLPLLFLFDELLEGTNSHDRRVGAEGLLRALLARRAIGIVTTHDLALTEIASELGSTVQNVHFQDYVEHGKMQFDYRLREGVVARSNALELMRLIGLEI